MPFVFPGSSEQVHATPAAFEPPPEVRDKLAALSADEPLPETYPADLVRLLVQSPYRAHVYWNHARDPFETLRRAFGAQQAARYRVALKLQDLESGEESFFEASPFARNYWFNVRPGRSYRALVGLFAPGRPFIRLLSSEVARTPRVTVSHLTDETPEFRTTPAEFSAVLNEAGYASDALEVTLEAVDAATQDATTRRLTRSFVGADAPTAEGGGLHELRALLSALAFGVPLASLLPLLSPEMAAWLRGVVAGREAEINSHRLLGILRAQLSLELEYDPRFDAATHDEARRHAEFAWGGSDVNLPTGIPHLRTPSLSEGLVSRLARWRETKQQEVGGQ